jgi:hypothetical protein
MNNFISLFRRTLFARFVLSLCFFSLLFPAQIFSQERAPRYEYLWYEAENMEGLARDRRNEPVLYPSWTNLPAGQTTGWAINGPGTSAEWTQGGESEWNSIAASPADARATVHQDIEIPRAGAYKVWVRYADWARRTENFTLRLTQNGREVFRYEFGASDVVDPHDETSMYWGWAFAWNSATANNLEPGAARITIEIERPGEARRIIDCVLVTNDHSFTPEGREKPDFAAMRHLREWSERRTPLVPLVDSSATSAREIPAAWRRAPIVGRDFVMPWNIAPEFWEMYDRPASERPLYPFNAEPIDAFAAQYRGARDVPIFSSRLIAPVIHIPRLDLLKEGGALLRFLRETRAPFAVLINYGAANLSEADGQAVWRTLNGELRDQFIGWISGESIGHVYSDVAANLTLNPQMSRTEMLEAYRAAYTRALERKWSGTFHTQTGAMWRELISAQSTSSTAFAHALARWGSRTLGMETAAVQPMTAMRIAFTRGAARQYGGNFLYYHAPNFGDTATTFTNVQNFAGPNHFYHSRYGATMGPSLSWYRKSYYLYYMGGASAIYLEQGGDQFFRPGPGEHPFQLNPLGRITDEFIRFAEAHPERGEPYTPVAFLLDPAHGWDMTDYPHLPFGVSAINRGDRALRELFGAAYFPGTVVEGEPAMADRQAFVNGIFGDIFDVLVASDARWEAINSYRALVVGGRINWSRGWNERLRDYAARGGTIVINAAQTRGLSEELLGVRLTGEMRVSDEAQCVAPNETSNDLSGQMFRYERVEARGAQILIRAPNGDPLVTVNQTNHGRIVFCAIPDLLGMDERMTTVGAHLIAHLCADIAPVRVRGEVQHLINRTSRGWIVTLFNNQGVMKPPQGMAQVDRRATVEVAVDLRGGNIRTAREWTTDAPLEVMRDSQSLRVRIPAGGVRIIELIEAVGER